MLPKEAVVGLAFLTVLVIGTYEVELKAGCKIETLRACGDDYVPYGNGPRMEVSGESFNKSCATQKEQVNCSMQFARDCLYGVPKIAAGLTLSAFDDNAKGICKVGSEQHEAYRNAIGCMNSVGTKINACLKGYHSLVQRAVVKAQAQHVIGHACCSYHAALDCLRNALTPCDSAGSNEFATGLLGKVFGETLYLVCGKYTEGSEACKNLPEVPKLGPHDRRVDNYVELLVEVASKVGRQK